MDNFKPYLDNVSNSGGRTRSFVYVLILINICILAAVLNSIAPAWDDKRRENLNIALLCFSLQQKPHECTAAIDYAERGGFDFVAKGSSTDRRSQIEEVKRQLRSTIDAYHKKDIDENAFNIPVFNVPLDVNDIWVLSGLFNCYLMYLLVVCFDREYDDLVLAKAHLRSNEDIELLLATQMLGRSPKRKTALPWIKCSKCPSYLHPFYYI